DSLITSHLSLSALPDTTIVDSDTTPLNSLNSIPLNSLPTPQLETTKMTTDFGYSDFFNLTQIASFTTSQLNTTNVYSIFNYCEFTPCLLITNKQLKFLTYHYQFYRRYIS